MACTPCICFSIVFYEFLSFKHSLYQIIPMRGREGVYSQIIPVLMALCINIKQASVPLLWHRATVAACQEPCGCSKFAYCLHNLVMSMACHYKWMFYFTSCDPKTAVWYNEFWLHQIWCTKLKLMTQEVERQWIAQNQYYADFIW